MPRLWLESLYIAISVFIKSARNVKQYSYCFLSNSRVFLYGENGDSVIFENY